ncbi:hypothetical protein [Alienimonas californiensis]|nr:hypothetical protein [Alienimonas californiensis]
MHVKQCPYCGQTALWRAAVEGVAGEVVMCFECDTVWADGAATVYGEGLEFERFMSARGRAPDWQAVREIKRL